MTRISKLSNSKNCFYWCGILYTYCTLLLSCNLHGKREPHFTDLFLYTDLVPEVPMCCTFITIDQCIVQWHMQLIKNCSVSFKNHCNVFSDKVPYVLVQYLHGFNSYIFTVSFCFTGVPSCFRIKNRKGFLRGRIHWKCWIMYRQYTPQFDNGTLCERRKQR